MCFGGGVFVVYHVVVLFVCGGGECSCSVGVGVGSA